MEDIQTLSLEIRKFAERRNWEGLHTAKNLAMALAGEVGELAAEFQWLTPEESMTVSGGKRQAIEMEIADVAIYLLRLCDVLSIELTEVINRKLDSNEIRFPLTN